jgi:C4-dicarboxylate-specific signal transduction histidine kinase
LYLDGKNCAIRQLSANWRITHFIAGPLAATPSLTANNQTFNKDNKHEVHNMRT